MFFRVKADHRKFKQVSYLNMVFLLAVFTLGFYFVRYNTIYGMGQLNIPLVVLYSILMCAPIYFFKSQDFYGASLLVVVPAFLSMFLLLYVAGGLMAPGVFWLTSLPVILGFLFERRGLWVGVLALGLATALLGFIWAYDLGVNIIRSSGREDEERIINTILFFIFISANSVYYLSLEERYIEDIKAKKKESDSLLKVLMHDIATPLTILQIESSKLKAGEATTVSPETVERVGKTVDSMSRLLIQLREIRAMKRNSHFYDVSLVDLGNAVRDAIAAIVKEFSNQGMSFNLDIPDQEKLVVADEKGLREIVLNTILTNAVLSSPPDSWIDVRIYDSFLEGRNGVVLEVRDYGQPLTAEQLKSVFSLEDKVTKVSRVSDFVYAFPLMKGYLEKVGAGVSIFSFDGVKQAQGNMIRVFFPNVED